MINREVIYERTMTGSYMKIPEGVNPGLDERLMLKGKLKGTLPVEKTFIDGDGQYWYNISGKQSLDTYCRMKEIGIGFVERLVISICSELELLEWNLIHTGCLMLDPELVFITNSNREFIFTLYPGSNTEIGKEFQQLMEYLLTRIDHKDERAVRAAYGIYEKTLEPGYSIMDIRDSIVRAKEAAEAEETAERPPLSARADFSVEKRSTGGAETSAGKAAETRARAQRRGIGQESAPLVRHSRKQSRADEGTANLEEHARKKNKAAANKNFERKIDKTGKRHRPQERIWQGLFRYVRRQLGFEEETVCGEQPVVYPEEEVYLPREEYYPTVCLSSLNGAPRGVLLYQGAEQLSDIPLEAGVVRIGHGREADACIERDTISQFHARIDRDGDSYYIEDLNSTNGTSVNEEALAYKERRQLKVNDIVQFADVRYRFC